jgi:hypothetical protein
MRYYASLNTDSGIIVLETAGIVRIVFIVLGLKNIHILLERHRGLLKGLGKILILPLL